MRALFLQHDPGSHPGLVGAAMARRGIQVELLEMSGTIADGTWTGRFPAATDYDLLVPLGAIWSLNDRTQVGTWIDEELALLREADRAGVPVLGICFGGQALAAAHGGTVEPASSPELGWRPIETDVPDLIAPGPWMQWHSDRFLTPPDAVELARNDRGTQAFRLRRNLAVQFHPEVDEAGITRWLDLGGELADAALEEAGTDAGTVLADARTQRERAVADVERLVDGFLRSVAGLTPPRSP